MGTVFWMRKLGTFLIPSFTLMATIFIDVLVLVRQLADQPRIMIAKVRSYQTLVEWSYLA